MEHPKSNIKKNYFKKIIVPIDGSNLSKKAAKVACYLGEQLNIKIIFFHVVNVTGIIFGTGEVTYDPEMNDVLREHGKSILNSFKESFSNMNVKIKTVMVEGIPDDEIIKEAKKDDLVIMGSKGQSALERILIGSVTEKVIHHTDATVMVVR